MCESVIFNICDVFIGVSVLLVIILVKILMMRVIAASASEVGFFVIVDVS